jgi:hypothetical protein
VYRRQVRQLVLYVGQPKMRMEDRLDLGDTKVSYRLLDIREVDAGELLRSARPGDLVLAMLAKGGTERLTEIAQRTVLLSGAERSRVLTQLVLLSGLRALSGSIIRDLTDQAQAKGRGEGIVQMLREQMQTKFGPLPKWAEERLSQGSAVQMERWARKVLAAKTLKSVLGKK